MIFSSWQFAFFFIPVFFTYWSLPTRRGRHAFLLLASYFFYMAWNPWLVTILIALTTLDFFIALGLNRTENPKSRKLLLIATLVSNLGVLAIFKYADFFIVSFRELFFSLGFNPNLSTLSIILPVGISFHTFQTMSYTIDVYRRETPVTRSYIDFALFVAFFPQLVAGPIVKAREFLPQLETIKRFTWDRMESGTVLFMVGLTKKLLIADNLATLVDPVFSDPTQYQSRDLWLAMFCYGGQICCDFSGYTDMAIAIARMMGFDFSANFASPYLATSLSDFWRRWHISLSTWLRDYLYIPLGGSRCGRILTARNLMLTMLLGGLWHGASWTFVIWGAIHGAALVVTSQFRRISATVAKPVRQSPKRPIAQSPNDHHAFGPPWLRTFLGWSFTLLLVHLAWVFFRCQPMTVPGSLEPEPTSAALARAVYFVTHLFMPANVADPAWLMNKVPMVMLLALLMALHLYEDWIRRGRPRLRLPAPVAGIGYATWITALVLFSPENASPFIYFQF